MPAAPLNDSASHDVRGQLPDWAGGRLQPFNVRGIHYKESGGAKT
jgi:hypothetical protein